MNLIFIILRQGFQLRARFSRVNSLVLKVMSSCIMAAQLLRTTMALKFKHWERQASEATHTASDSRTSSDGVFLSSSSCAGDLYSVSSLLTRYVRICRHFRITTTEHMSSSMTVCNFCDSQRSSDLLRDKIMVFQVSECGDLFGQKRHTNTIEPRGDSQRILDR